MRILGRLKPILFISLSSLYLTGLIVWVMSRWFFVTGTLGPEPSPFRLWWLEIHSVVGLWFLLLFGYLFHSHVEPSWRRGRRKKSGVALTATTILLCLTVPGLFYLTDESLRLGLVWTHTYLGLASLLIFLVHRFAP